MGEVEAMRVHRKRSPSSSPAKNIVASHPLCRAKQSKINIIIIQESYSCLTYVLLIYVNFRKSQSKEKFLISSK